MYRHSWWLPAFALGAPLALVGFLFLLLHKNDDAQPIEQELVHARAELNQGNYAAAEGRAKNVLANTPSSILAREIAGEAAARQGRFDQALAYCRQLGQEDSPDAAEALYKLGESMVELGRLSEAESCFRWALDANPRSIPSHGRLAFVLSVAGRRFESSPHLFALVRGGKYSSFELILLGDVGQTLPSQPREAVRCRQAAPGDPQALLASACLAELKEESPEAQNLLRQALALDPRLIEAQARLGRLLQSGASPGDFVQWQQQLPANAGEHPEIWAIRGTWARDHGEKQGAARCFWEAARIDPNHATANQQLGQLLAGLGRRDEARGFQERGERLQRLAAALSKLDDIQPHFYDVPSKDLIRQVCELAEELGRPWEARAWADVAWSSDRELKWPQEIIERLTPGISDETPRTLVTANPALEVDLSDWPLPLWQGGAPAEPRPGGVPAATIRFAEGARQAGIDFTYYNAPDPSTEGMRMFEFTGGGVGSLDYDGDMWPDLYFAQGCKWPVDSGQREHLDRLYRNLGNGRFVEISAQARLVEERFSQGLAVGDVNNDGFPDLYVANVGLNRLWVNQGDGTFEGVTLVSGASENKWTTSCVIVDLNGDGHPEIFDVNYVAGSNVYTLICRDQGASRACKPTEFQPEQDRLFHNLADGRFADVSETAGIFAPKGLGLGVVAADFDGSRRLSLFVANDATPNFLFVPKEKRHPARPLEFEERAYLAGVAVDRDGAPQACMGVAAGDANGDGLLDLFITNFYAESDTLYVQESPGLFNDVTRRAGLRELGFYTLGFGTQFLDADLDGLPDLVMTNGDVDDFSFINRPYRQSPQFMRNVGGGKFVEIPAKSLGPFFAGQYLGRGLARVDWNRDGREDFVVSHLDSPAALVTNETPDAGHFLAVQLRGVKCSRDAIGALVTVKASRRRWVSQLTAGDGYMASNQRQLIFGLGELNKIDELEIGWPSGARQVFRNLAVDRQILVIEGNDEIISLPASN